jgi:hypothetical protein
MPLQNARKRVEKTGSFAVEANYHAAHVSVGWVIEARLEVGG